MEPERESAGRQYVVFHLKLIEVLHLILLNLHLTETGACPENVMGHGVDRFKETLLGVMVNAYMSLSDDPKSTNARSIWKRLYPKHARAIDRIWRNSIVPGEGVMKAYRDQAGVHGDQPHKYFAGKFQLFANNEKIVLALNAFLSLSICLLRRQKEELPELPLEIEGVLLDIELGWKGRSFNRRWLRAMHLIEGGSYSRKFL